jgi:carbamoyl-phosphate synthase large subunit
MIDELLKFFVLFFVVVEPISLVPLFAALTEGADEAFRRRMALKAVLIPVNDYDKSAALKLGRDFHRMGFKLFATAGTAAALKRVDLPVTAVSKAGEGGSGPNTVDLIKSGEIGLVINTPLGERAYEDQTAMRSAAIQFKVPLISTLSAAQAAVNGIRALREKELSVRSLQVHHRIHPPGS